MSPRRVSRLPSPTVHSCIPSQDEQQGEEDEHFDDEDFDTGLDPEVPAVGACGFGLGFLYVLQLYVHILIPFYFQYDESRVWIFSF